MHGQYLQLMQKPSKTASRWSVLPGKVNEEGLHVASKARLLRGWLCPAVGWPASCGIGTTGTPGLNVGFVGGGWRESSFSPLLSLVLAYCWSLLLGFALRLEQLCPYLIHLNKVRLYGLDKSHILCMPPRQSKPKTAELVVHAVVQLLGLQHQPGHCHACHTHGPGLY